MQECRTRVSQGGLVESSNAGCSGPPAYALENVNHNNIIPPRYSYPNREP